MATEKPLVSVIIATYNRSNVLKFSIASVLKQDYQNFEIIVIGDHCTDDTEEVINSFADKRISFYNLEENFGEQSFPNNIGFQKSNGALIAWLNHDDLWYPEHLSTLMETLYQNDSDLVYSWFLPYNVHKFNLAYNLPVFTKENRYFPFCFIPASTWLVKRDTITKAGLWKSAREIYNAPSQEWINRVNKLGMKITPINKLSVIAIQSGCRKDSYLNREVEEHEYVFERMYSAEFRENVLTELCYHLALRHNRVSLKEYFWFFFKKPIAFFAIRYQFSPHGLSNRIRFRKKGGVIDYLRDVRGLSKLNRDTK